MTSSLNGKKNLTSILIGGCSRSGKSLLASYLCENFKALEFKCHIISLDSWLISVEDRKLDSTVLERYDRKAIIDSMKEVLKGNDVYPPVYDPVSRRRIAQRSKNSICVQSGIVMIEGVIALAIKELLDIANIKIFVGTDDRVRLERVKYFYTKIKGLTISEAERIILPREIEEVPFIKKTAEYADLIFINNMRLLQTS